MLCEVRVAIADNLGLDVKYTDPNAVIARYAELMAENARREAAKASKTSRSGKRSQRNAPS